MNIKELKVNDIVIYKPSNSRYIILEINLGTFKVKSLEKKEYITYISNWMLLDHFRHPTKLERILT